MVTPLVAGTTVITITTTDGSLQEDSITLTVSTTAVAVTGVIIDQGATASVTMVETLGLTATVSPGTATDSSVTWESGSETVATIDSANGVVTPLTVGTTTITVKTNGVNSGGTLESADITITVTKEAITGTLSYSSITTTSGTEATASPIWDPVLGDQTVIYTISPDYIAGISIDAGTGKVTVGTDAVVAGSGTYAVTATGTGNYEGTITADIVITVNIPPTPTNIALASANLVTVTTDVPDWWTENGTEGLVNVNDGNKSTEGSWDIQAHPTGARGKHITFTFNETYSNGSFLFYNRSIWPTGIDPRLRINGATVQFYKDDAQVGTKGTLNTNNAINGIITITQAIDVVFNKVVMTFPDENDEDNNQNFREIEIMGIPAP